MNVSRGVNDVEQEVGRRTIESRRAPLRLSRTAVTGEPGRSRSVLESCGVSPLV